VPDELTVAEIDKAAEDFDQACPPWLFDWPKAKDAFQALNAALREIKQLYAES